ncbi:TPA: hypothetical protein ACNMQC_005682, partial [Klebsiella pneumoniae]
CQRRICRGSAMGAWGGAMNFEPENYSRRALLWFAAVIDIAGWVAVFVVTWGICMVIEWWVA